MAEEGAGKRRISWRAALRAIHRDAGNLVIGLTLIYALSGIAVNHITDWTDGDPSFANYQQTHELGGPLEGDDQAVSNRVLERLGIKDKPTDVYRPVPTELEISFKQRTLHVNTETGKVLDEGQKPRFFLRVANWLHLNRGKKAWTYVADAYGVVLIFLAFSGMFMLPGRKGLIGRGGIFVALGIAIPVIYVTWSGGP